MFKDSIILKNFFLRFCPLISPETQIEREIKFVGCFLLGNFLYLVKQ